MNYSTGDITSYSAKKGLVLYEVSKYSQNIAIPV